LVFEVSVVVEPEVVPEVVSLPSLSDDGPRRASFELIYVVVHESRKSFVKFDAEAFAVLPFEPLPEYQEYDPVDVVVLPVPE
jgi:hypothetical protein